MLKKNALSDRIQTGRLFGAMTFQLIEMAEGGNLATSLAGSALGAASAGSCTNNFVATAVGARGFHVGVTDGGFNALSCCAFGFSVICAFFLDASKKVGDGTVDRFFLHGLNFGHGEFGLTLVRRCFFAVSRDKFTAHPTKYVVGK